MILHANSALIFRPAFQKSSARHVRFWPTSGPPRPEQTPTTTLNDRAHPLRLHAVNAAHAATLIADSFASIDVEFAHFGSRRASAIAAAEVCLLAGDGTTLWHSFIHPEHGQLNWRGGVSPKSYQQAPDLHTVQQKLLPMLTGRLLIGYGLNKDLCALGIDHPKSMQKDLIKYKKFSSRSGKQARRLQDVAYQFLGYRIQSGKHSAREDAHAALQLYLLHIKNDPDLMTFEELVEFELSSMQLRATPDAD